MTGHVRIFDTTLRDGEQAPGFSMDEAGKLRIARALAALRVDIIEAGFAAASPGDARADRGGGARGGGADHLLARPRHARRHRRGGEGTGAGAAQAHPRLPGHQPDPPGGEAAHDARAGARGDPGVRLLRARGVVDDVEFSAEDAIRTERDFLVECLTAAVESGATTLNVPDTVGYTTPEEIYDLFRFLGEQVTRSGRGHLLRPLP